MLARIKKSSVIFFRVAKRNNGFFLADILAGLALIMILASLFLSGFFQCLYGWKVIQSRQELFQAGRYMQGMLEKGIAYNAVEVRIIDHAKIKCATIAGNKKVTYRFEDNGLYVDTLLAKESGTNPLYVPSCSVSEWKVEKLSSDLLSISFVLTNSSCREKFFQVLRCLNGVVIDE